jgi:TIR domain
MAHDVFISYSSKDQDAGYAACEVLERHGVRCWMAPRNIVPGVGWAKSIVQAIGQSRAMVLILSANANISPQIEREVERAINKGVPIIPFRIENVTPSDALEYFLSAPHWLDAFSPPLERHLDRLAEAVHTLLDSKTVAKQPRGGDDHPANSPMSGPGAMPSAGLQQAGNGSRRERGRSAKIAMPGEPSEQPLPANPKLLFVGIDGVKRKLIVLAALAVVTAVMAVVVPPTIALLALLRIE